MMSWSTEHTTAVNPGQQQRLRFQEVLAALPVWQASLFY